MRSSGECGGLGEGRGWPWLGLPRPPLKIPSRCRLWAARWNRAAPPISMLLISSGTPPTASGGGTTSLVGYTLWKGEDGALPGLSPSCLLELQLPPRTLRGKPMLKMEGRKKRGV